MSVKVRPTGTARRVLDSIDFVLGAPDGLLAARMRVWAWDEPLLLGDWFYG